jgi:hypothetical protein
MRVLTRKEIREGLTQIPIEKILNVSNRDLTTKQKRFAQEVAMGSTKAEAYRRAYKKNPSKHTILNEPYRLSADPRISAEVDAYKLALESAKHRTPQALRELVIKTLVDVAINPDAKDAIKVQAVKVLGTVVEVGAFLERKEVHTITSSEDTKAKIMSQLKAMLRQGAEDATIIEADTLLKELAGDPHPIPTPQAEQIGVSDPIHTIPLKSSQSEVTPPLQKPPEQDPTPSFRDDAPL